jgi:polyhydroxyalkanoate synthase subunit PhaC
MTDLSTTPFEIHDYDNPESVRARKYATGVHLRIATRPPEVGRTPKEVVWEKNKSRVYRYGAGETKRHAVPVLLVYALILRPYILDLVPGNSLVEHLLGEGFDVYLLDWGVPGEEDAGLSFEHLVLDYLPEAVQSVLRSSGSEELTLFGYCQGGTIAAMYASLFPNEGLRNLVLLATPLDFAPEDPGPLGLWTLWSRNSGYFLDPDLLSGMLANARPDLPGLLARAATSLLGPLGVGANVAEIPRRENERLKTFLAACRWVDEGVPFPGEAFRRWIKDFYQRNLLARGELKLRGSRVDLSNIVCPVLAVAGAGDYICPLSQAEPAMDLVGGDDKELFVPDAGHVGLMVGPVAKQAVRPRICEWLGDRSR